MCVFRAFPELSKTALFENDFLAKKLRLASQWEPRRKKAESDRCAALREPNLNKLSCPQLASCRPTTPRAPRLIPLLFIILKFGRQRAL
jgi:hypothetical protein